MGRGRSFLGTGKNKVTASDARLGSDSVRSSSGDDDSSRPGTRPGSGGDDSSRPGSAAASLRGGARSHSVNFPVTAERAAAAAAAATSLPSDVQAAWQAGSGRLSPMSASARDPGGPSGGVDGSRPSPSAAVGAALRVDEGGLWGGTPPLGRDFRSRSVVAPAGGRLRPSSAGMSVLDVALMPMRGMGARPSSMSGDEDSARLTSQQVCVALTYFPPRFLVRGWRPNLVLCCPRACGRPPLGMCTRNNLPSPQNNLPSPPLLTCSRLSSQALQPEHVLLSSPRRLFWPSACSPASTSASPESTWTGIWWASPSGSPLPATPAPCSRAAGPLVAAAGP